MFNTVKPPKPYPIFTRVPPFLLNAVSGEISGDLGGLNQCCLFYYRR